MTLRLATGNFRGKKIASTDKARELRPTQALLREAIINISQNLVDFEEANILDIYAGVGSVGLEFLSNDAKFVYFVEKDPRCVKLLKSNILSLGCESKTKVLNLTLPSSIKRVKDPEMEGFDLIFADPPYKLKANLFFKNIDFILENALMKPDSLLICEYADREYFKGFENYQDSLKLIKEKKYGDSFLIFLQKIS